MERPFLDVNILFSGVHRPGAGLLQLWKLKNVVLCSFRYALEEARINLDNETQRKQLIMLSERLHFFEATRGQLPRGISLPEKDVPILLAALEAGATHLLTGDIRHFGAFSEGKSKALRSRCRQNTSGSGA